MNRFSLAIVTALLLSTLADGRSSRIPEQWFEVALGEEVSIIGTLRDASGESEETYVVDRAWVMSTDAQWQELILSGEGANFSFKVVEMAATLQLFIGGRPIPSEDGQSPTNPAIEPFFSVVAKPDVNDWRYGTVEVESLSAVQEWFDLNEGHMSSSTIEPCVTTIMHVPPVAKHAFRLSPDEILILLIYPDGFFEIIVYQRDTDGCWYLGVLPIIDDEPGPGVIFVTPIDPLEPAAFQILMDPLNQPVPPAPADPP